MIREITPPRIITKIFFFIMDEKKKYAISVKFNHSINDKMFYLCKFIISLNFQSNNYFHLSKLIARLGLDDELNITNLVIIELHIGHIISEARFSCVLSCVSPFYKLSSIYLHLTTLFLETLWRDFWYFWRSLGFWVSEIFIKNFFLIFWEENFIFWGGGVKVIEK